MQLDVETFVAIARELDILSEVCHFNEYDPKTGERREFFTPKATYLKFFEDLLKAKGKEDVRRMDWLCDRTLNVREPLPYGSMDLFWASPTDDDRGHTPSDLRSQVDTAMKKEKP